MNTDKTTNSSAVFCAPLEDSCMEGQTVSEVDAVSAVNGVDGESEVSEVDEVDEARKTSR